MDESRSSPWRLLWHRADQPALAGVLLTSFLLLMLFVWQQWRAAQGVIDIDSAPPLEVGFQVDLNSADWAELAVLPGIGQVLGRSIVDYRRARGGFQTVEQVIEVPGIGPGKFEQIRPYLVVRPVE